MTPKNPKLDSPSATISHTHYLTLIYRLGLTPTGKKTALYLGLSVRQLERINARHAGISGTLARLLTLYAIVTAENKPLKQRRKKLTTPPKIEKYHFGRRPPGRPKRLAPPIAPDHS